MFHIDRHSAPPITNTSPLLSLSLPRSLLLPSSLTISLIPCFLPNPVECKQRTRNPPANLHLITTITTGDSRETTSSLSPSPLPLPPTFHFGGRSKKRTHSIAFRTIGSRSSLRQWYPARFSLTKYFAFHCATESHVASISYRILTMKNSSYVFCSPYFFLLQLITSKKGTINPHIAQNCIVWLHVFISRYFFVPTLMAIHHVLSPYHISAHQFIPQSYNSISYC